MPLLDLNLQGSLALVLVIAHIFKKCSYKNAAVLKLNSGFVLLSAPSHTGIIHTVYITYYLFKVKIITNIWV